MKWAERIDVAVDEFYTWKELPMALAMDRAMKRAGFRELIVENLRLKEVAQAAQRFVAAEAEGNDALIEDAHFQLLKAVTNLKD